MHNQMTLALTVYREMIGVDHIPTVEIASQVLGCLQLPFNADLKSRLVENVGVSVFITMDQTLFIAASLGIVPIVSFKGSPIKVDARKLQIHFVKVRVSLASSDLLIRCSKLPNVTILLSIEKIQIVSAEGEKTIKLAERMSQAVTSLLLRLGLTYQGNESLGKIRINGLSLRRWFQPKLATPFGRKPGEPSSFHKGIGITHQQHNIRTGNLSLD
ncbi:hypothetical protein Ddye_012910 [Dipteronia dyeriana]|uniref:Uncharacterized protein n=1 Tax=Dipteronia dyeriana TaxID=168575 RepID=A0AAD9X5B4_9ROSI|nr:hypothetical protein Ddye_012910 [Dipteronia dyeriana]